MSKMEERYEGSFLDALDLPEGKLVSVVIESVADPLAEKDSAGKPIKNAIVAFKGKSKRLILNTTNFKNLKALFSRDPKDWIGKTISIQRRYLDAVHGFGCNNTLCIRIIPPVGTPILKSAANFMGQPHPYGDAKQKPAPAVQPETKPAPSVDEVAQWAEAINPLTSVEAVEEFIRTVLPAVPPHLKQQVADMAALKLARIKHDKQETI